jgi:hypothetical protein
MNILIGILNFISLLNYKVFDKKEEIFNLVMVST